MAWRIGHIADLLTEERNAVWLGVPGREVPGRAPITAGDALEALDVAIAVWLDVLSAVPVESLGEPIGPVAGAPTRQPPGAPSCCTCSMS